MAFADKITTMRRMAIIMKNHNIEWEGVNIEGTCLLKQICTHNIMLKTEEELIDWLDTENIRRRCVNWAELEIKYQDPEDKGYWEPRRG